MATFIIIECWLLIHVSDSGSLEPLVYIFWGKYGDIHIVCLLSGKQNKMMERDISYLLSR